MALIEAILSQLGARVLERGWLSSNNIVFEGSRQAPPTVVDTGYDLHAEQTVELVRGVLGGTSPERVLNTHLHSDHCGGNAALQVAWRCDVIVPAASLEAASSWDEQRLTFLATGQTCRQFSVHGALHPGSEVRLGPSAWQVLEAPGHDPEAVMLFEPRSRVLISGDALWENRLAIIFPELAGMNGFGEARRVLHAIESLEPALVIPGHGRPFADIRAALARSRQRLDQFEMAPERHIRSATRALVMFRMLELRRCRFDELLSWLLETPIFANLPGSEARSPEGRSSDAEQALLAMVSEGLLKHEGRDLLLPSG